MLCDNCGEREAAIHLTQIVDNSGDHAAPVRAVRGGEGRGDRARSVAKFPLGDFLASLGKTAGAGAGRGASGAACPACGGTLQDFRRDRPAGVRRVLHDVRAASARPAAPPARQLAARRRALRRARPAPAAGEPPAAASAPELGELREQLRRAVEAENFELAAELRDRLKVLE